MSLTRPVREPGKRFSTVVQRSRCDHVQRAIPLVLAVAISALMVIRYWYLSGPYPPGLDGAQWLSYGRVLFGGAARGAESTYAPLIPIVVHSLGLAAGPFLGLRISAALLLVLIAGAVLLLCIQLLGRTWGSLTAALVLPCTAFAEPFFYGGFPQQASLTFGLFGITFIVSARRAMADSVEIRGFAAASVCFVLASASHLLFGPLLLSSAALTALGLGAARPNQRLFLLRSTATLLPAALTSFLVALAYFRHDYVAPLAASHRTPGEAWIYATREAPWLWATIMIVGTLGALATMLGLRVTSPSVRGRSALPSPVAVGLGLMVPATTLMVASGQPRLAPPVLLGGAILAGFAGQTAMRPLANVRLLALAIWCLASIWLAGVTTEFTREFAQFYQVLDASLFAATRSVSSSAPGAIAVAADHRGWPVGWWAEALQTSPVFVGSDPGWLAFPEERSRAEIVTHLLASPDGAVLQQRAGEAGVLYLMLRKWDWIGWERWVTSAPPAPAVIYDDNETIVLRIVPATSQRPPAWLGYAASATTRHGANL